MRRIIATTIASAAMLTGTIAPAAAGTMSIPDAKRDVGKRGLDIRGLKVTHGKHWVKSTIRIRNLRKNSRGRIGFLYDAKRRSKGAEFGIVLRLRPKKNGARIVIARTRPDGDFKRRIRCAYRGRMNAKKNRIHVRVPRRCFDRPKRIRVKSATARGGRTDYAPNAASWSRRIKRG